MMTVVVTVYSVTLTWTHVGTQGEHRGDWIPPGSEDRLPLLTDASADVYEVHGVQRVDLRRRNNANMPSGIYRCDIVVHNDNDTVVTESVYVGLYTRGGIVHNSA